MAQYSSDSKNQPIAVTSGLVIRDPLMAEALMSKVAAAGTVDFTGTETNGNILTLAFTSSQLPASNGYAAGTYGISLTTSGSESMTAIATAFKNLINADPLLSSLGVTATSSAAVLTINWAPGPLGNFATIALIVGGATPIVTFTNTPTAGDYVNVTISNGELPGFKRNVQYKVVSGDSSLTLLATHVAAAITADPVLAAAGIAATSASGVVTITFPATIGAVLVACSANGSETATLGGTATTGDVVTLTVSDAALPGGSQAIPYTVKSTDTSLTILGSSIAKAVNANLNLDNLGVSASAASGVITLKSTSANATTYARTLSGGATETVTLAGGPGETATASGNATETSTLTPFVGGSGYIVPQQDAEISHGGTLLKLSYGQPRLVAYGQLKAILDAGVTVK